MGVAEAFPGPLTGGLGVLVLVSLVAPGLGVPCSPELVLLKLVPVPRVDSEDSYSEDLYSEDSYSEDS